MDLDFQKDPSILGDIVDAMAVGVFTVDPSGHFVAWSDGAERITGYSRDHVKGQPCNLLEGPNCKGFGTLTELLNSPPAPDNCICDQECKVLARDGRELHIHGSVRVLRDAQGAIAGAVGSFTDVTSLVLANQKIARLEAQAGATTRFERLIGQSQAMQEVFRRLKLAAHSDVAVLVTGESGTGKELAAEAIHAQSERYGQPFVAVNCSALPETLLESELFGHVHGAFTGAVSDKVGVFEAAHQGTLFLDEIGDVSQAIQVKLLRVLQEREIRRVGDSRTRQVDVRLVTATNNERKKLGASGAAREHFFYRIHVFEIHMPPLRERPEDIPLLVEHFIDELCRKKGQRTDGIARDALQALTRYHWPGNVRQLRNAIEHACVTVSGDRISLLDLPPDVRSPDRPAPPVATPALSQEEQSERDQIVAALDQTGGNRTKAAKLLGTSRVTLWKKIGKYAIEPPA